MASAKWRPSCLGLNVFILKEGNCQIKHHNSILTMMHFEEDEFRKTQPNIIRGL